VARVTRVDHTAHPTEVVPNLSNFYKDIRKLGPEFRTVLRIANIQVAKHVVLRARQNARTAAERQVAKAIEARPDTIPKIVVNTRTTFVSSSRPNAKRKPGGKARAIDVFFGTEFGGGKFKNAGSDTNAISHKGRLVRKGGGYTTQFRPHQGTVGYFFYPTVRREQENTMKMYARTIDEVRKKWERGAL